MSQARQDALNAWNAPIAPAAAAPAKTLAPPPAPAPVVPFFEQAEVNAYAARLSAPEHLYTFQTLAAADVHRTLLAAIRRSCGNAIGDGYMQDMYTGIVRGRLDLVVCLDRDLSQVSARELYRYVTGILIINQGECHRYPNVPCIALICSTHGKGRVLMGLYLYAIMGSTRLAEPDRQGMLELANGYLNLGGLCLYSKYGFSLALDLTASDCFPDASNLPMVVHVRAYGATREAQQDRLLRIVNGQDPGFPKPPSCSLPRDDQLLYGAVFELVRARQLDPNYVPSQRMLASGEVVDMAALERLETLPDRHNMSLRELCDYFITRPSATPPAAATAASAATRTTRRSAATGATGAAAGTAGTETRSRRIVRSRTTGGGRRRSRAKRLWWR